MLFTKVVTWKKGDKFIHEQQRPRSDHCLPYLFTEILDTLLTKNKDSDKVFHRLIWSFNDKHLGQNFQQMMF